MNLNAKSGFFTEYYLSIRNNCNINDIEKCSEFKNDLERIQYIDNEKFVRDHDLNIQRKFLGKSIQKCLEYKEKGNFAFNKQKYIEALTLYTTSLIATPNENRKEIAILYANRSAALYHLEKYDESLLDIERSVKFGYPKEIMHKILERSARCYLANKDYSRALDAFKKTITALDDCKIPLEKRKRIESDIMIMIQLLNKDPNTKRKITTKKNSKNHQKSKEFLSDAIRIDYNELEGRYARAAGNVIVGDKILIEKPNICALLESFSKSHCQNCFKRSVTPIPCLKCDQVIFCSDQCGKEAAYHQYECGILTTIWRSGASINCHLALRIIASKPLKYFQKIKNQINENLQFDQLKKLPHNDYRRICNLVTHSDKRDSIGFFQYSLMARFLTQCLQQTDYFGPTPNIDDIQYIASLILRNLQFLQYNTHEISELHQSKQGQNNKTVFIGGGIYPTLALFNHSCDPSVVRYFCGTMIHVNAVKGIESGLPISENYGPLYAQETRAERQAKLKELYCFDCTCDACIEDWPRFVDMKNDEIRFRCDADEKCDNVLVIAGNVNDFMIKCTKCGQFTNILKGLKVMQDTEMISKTAKRFYEAGDFQVALDKYINLLRIMYEVLAPPFTDYCQTQQNIKDCYLNLGNAYALN